MSRRSERMQPIQRLAGDRSREAARVLAQRREALEQETERLAQLRGFRREYEQRLALSGQNGIDAYRLRDYNAFLARIDTAITQQQQSIDGLQAEVERLRDDWLRAWGNARALEQLVARYRDQERRRAEAREQRDSDELAQRLGGNGDVEGQ
ncbi:flagellar export protein FliJ [Arhodomonas sp. AD133]|uniref:flagellar export protein FliJ n=1 Tax=Arhodomonas sp. AD133 TaxID=3415009 RepID=UPI003EB941E9